MPTDIKTVESEWLEYAIEVLRIDEEAALSLEGGYVAVRSVFYSGWLSALSVLMPIYQQAGANVRQLGPIVDLIAEVKTFQDAVGDS